MLQKSPILDPSLKNLSYILRHKEWWPEGFAWDFRYCSHCAMGMCEELWSKPTFLLSDAEFCFEEGNGIFSRPVSMWKMPFRRHWTRMEAVTPEMVADRIDAYLASK